MGYTDMIFAIKSLQKKNTKFDDVLTMALDMEVTKETAQMLKPESTDLENVQSRFVHDSKPKFKKNSGKSSNAQSSQNVSNSQSSNSSSTSKYSNEFHKKIFQNM